MATKTKSDPVADARERVSAWRERAEDLARQREETLSELASLADRREALLVPAYSGDADHEARGQLRDVEDRERELRERRDGLADAIRQSEDGVERAEAELQNAEKAVALERAELKIEKLESEGGKLDKTLQRRLDQLLESVRSRVQVEQDLAGQLSAREAAGGRAARKGAPLQTVERRRLSQWINAALGAELPGFDANAGFRPGTGQSKSWPPKLTEVK